MEFLKWVTNSPRLVFPQLRLLNNSSWWIDCSNGPNELPAPCIQALCKCPPLLTLLGHLTCFVQWDGSKHDASRELKSAWELRLTPCCSWNSALHKQAQGACWIVRRVAQSPCSSQWLLSCLSETIKAFSSSQTTSWPHTPEHPDPRITQLTPAQTAKPPNHELNKWFFF